MSRLLLALAVTGIVWCLAMSTLILIVGLTVWVVLVAAAIAVTIGGSVFEGLA